MSDKKRDGVDPDLVRELASILADSGLSEIEVEHVSFVQLQRAVRGCDLAQMTRSIPIDLHGLERADAIEQWQRDRAQARSDFDQALARLGIDGVENPLDDASIMEEVLTEAFARTMHR